MLKGFQQVQKTQYFISWSFSELFFFFLIAQWNWRIITFSVNVKLMAFLNRKLAAILCQAVAHWGVLWPLRSSPLKHQTSFVVPSAALRNSTMEMEGDAGIFFAQGIEFSVSTNCSMSPTFQSFYNQAVLSQTSQSSIFSLFEKYVDIKMLILIIH